MSHVGKGGSDAVEGDTSCLHSVFRRTQMARTIQFPTAPQTTPPGAFGKDKVPRPRHRETKPFQFSLRAVFCSPCEPSSIVLRRITLLCCILCPLLRTCS